METKFCKKCGKTKSIDNFSKSKNAKDGLQLYCKDCNKAYKEAHKEEIKEYKERNQQKLREGKKRYRETHKEKIKKDGEEYRKRDYVKKRAIKRTEEKYHSDSLFRLKMVIRQNVRTSFTRKGMTKSERTEEIVGCSVEELINHLTKTYEDNYGEPFDWSEDVQIDHIIPLATASTEEEVKELCKWSNLQLLKAKDNLKKSARLDWKLQ